MAAILESTPERFVLQSGSNKLILDKAAGTATLQRKVMFVSLKPATVPLAEVADVTLHTLTDPMSKAAIEHVMVKLAAGGAWLLAANDRSSAQSAVDAIRGLLGKA